MTRSGTRPRTRRTSPAPAGPGRLRLVCMLAAILGGCSPSWYRKSADREVSEIIGKAQLKALGAARPFSVEPSERNPLDGLPVREPDNSVEMQPPAIEEERSIGGEGPVGEEPVEGRDGLPEGAAPGPEGPAPGPSGPDVDPAAPGTDIPIPEAGEGGSGSGEADGVPEAPRPGNGGEEAVVEPGAPGGEAAAPENEASVAAPEIPEARGEGTAGGSETQPSVEAVPPETVRVVDLDGALRVAVEHNREYQREREDLYLQVLSFTLARYVYRPRFVERISGTWRRDADDERSGSISNDFGWNLLFLDGASFSLSLVTDAFRFFTGPHRRITSSSTLNATLIQPLLSGAGRRVAAENLTQAERSVIYAVRQFERYRQEFSVRVASEYYRVLQQRDIVTNEYNNYQSLVRNRERSEALAEAGWLTIIQLDQARQQELAAKNRWVNALPSLQDARDRFKILLGVPTEAPLELDQEDLTTLRQGGIKHPEVALADAEEEALRRRLDLVNSREQVEDAERRVVVARDNLRVSADLVLGAQIPTEEDNPAKFRLDRGTYSVGLDVDLPVERTAERNAYREALISLDRQRRNYSLFEDNVRLGVRQGYRSLEQARQSYQIQLLSFRLAERRVDQTRLEFEAGRIQQRDLLEAQEALVEAQNALTAALVNHTIARMEFFRDIGLLRVDENGVWIEEQIGASDE